jgi:hypothetical protein
LEPTSGHVVGTVMRRSRGIGSRSRDGKEKYNVVWEFTTLGETSVSFSYLLDGHMNAQRLLKAREKMKPSMGTIVEKKKQKLLDGNAMLDDEECMMVSMKPCILFI